MFTLEELQVIRQGLDLVTIQGKNAKKLYLSLSPFNGAISTKMKSSGNHGF